MKAAAEAAEATGGCSTTVAESKTLAGSKGLVYQGPPNWADRVGADLLLSVLNTLGNQCFFFFNNFEIVKQNKSYI